MELKANLIWRFGVLGMSVFSPPVVSQVLFDDLTFIGAGVSVGESVFSREDDAQLNLQPYVFHHSDDGFIDGTLGNYSFLPWFGISGNLRVSPVSDDFNDIPVGIQDRDSSGELGVTLGTLGARLTYLHDVTDVHDGYELQLHLGRGFTTPIEGFTVSPYVEVDYRDKNLSSHLYSVSSDESTASGLSAFEASSTWVYKTGVIGLYDFSSHLVGISRFDLEHHDSASPLLQRDLGWTFSIGAAYRF
ncbi:MULTISPECIES: MipA/OmpV family protein [unclassified Vibrio]|uniref:MipA/OmpV family protein n=1 Tax=Vibrio sp. HB236076 TaxID=3232307 RepID=A0AB39HG71_9VIBR|nr:MipA/OmpV family protein [Vibrio sp. HB161653]MDP5254486.1 MipA/OmpV family protein [Vibrio sp. HB161653]